MLLLLFSLELPKTWPEDDEKVEAAACLATSDTADLSELGSAPRIVLTTVSFLKTRKVGILQRDKYNS